MTGTATGPHLDYRVFKNGTAIDPLRMDLPAVDPIAPEDMPQYLRSVSGYMKMVGLSVPDSLLTDSVKTDTINASITND
jgi:murein DD-endopeptidase MepM/ murein hydrolase activator NlpD